jgi:hypothetical protein
VRFISEPRRLVRLSWLIFLSVATAPARTTQLEQPGAPPPIEVIKLKWEKEARLPQNFDPSNGGASGSINDSATSARSGGGTGSGGGGGASTTQGMQPSAPSRVSFIYVYSMKVKNHGSKEIDGVAWDYVFLNPTTSAELGRHQFLSFEKVASDKTVTFQSEQRTPPVRIVRTQASEVNKHENLSEKSEIKCVLYADGTTWRDANTSEDVCNLLKKGKAGLSRKRPA